jgi:hypothetical protein
MKSVLKYISLSIFLISIGSSAFAVGEGDDVDGAGPAPAARAPERLNNKLRIRAGVVLSLWNTRCSSSETGELHLQLVEEILNLVMASERSDYDSLPAGSIVKLVRGQSSKMDYFMDQLVAENPLFPLKGALVVRDPLLSDPDLEKRRHAVPPFELSDKLPGGCRNHQAALGACPAGSTLATEAQLRALGRAMNVGGGYREDLVPNMLPFWSSELLAVNPAFAFVFHSGFDDDIGCNERCHLLTVRCVRSALAIIQ